jgi:RHS repeat-associated protein
MPDWRTFLLRLYRSIHQVIINPVAIALTALFLLFGFIAHADQVKTTITGTISSGTDTTGEFGTPGANLAGQTFSTTYLMNTATGSSYLGTWPSCSNGLQNSSLATPVPSVAVGITGGTFNGGSLSPYSLGSFVSSSNGTSPKTKVYHKLGQNFSTLQGNGMTGTESNTVEADINSATYCRNWSDSFLYTMTTGDSSSCTLSADYFSGGGAEIMADYSATCSITSISISGTSSIPSLQQSSAQTWGNTCHTCNAISWSSAVIPIPKTRGGSKICFYPMDTCQAWTDAAGNSEETLQQAFDAADPNSMTRDPINAAGGNMYMSETDFVGGGAASDLVFTRFYNSHDLTQSGLGVGWHSNYHRALAITSSTSVTVTNIGGSQDTFTLTGGNWVPQANVTTVLVSTTTPSGYKLTRQNDSVENYNSSGQLTSIVNRGGLTTSLSYTASGNLSTVTDPFSYALSFGYDALSRVTTLTLPDGTNNFGYGYDQYNNLAWVKNPDGTTYQYQHGAWPFTNLITGKYDENGSHYAIYTYDSQGRALTSSSAAGVDLTTLGYTTSTLSTVTDALGNTTSYTLTGNFGAIVPTTVGGVPKLSSGGASFTYDANGFIASRTDFNGNVTNYVHNAKGQETSRTEAYGTGLARTTTTIWDATYNRPTEIDKPLGLTTTLGYDGNGNLTTLSTTDGTHTRVRSWTFNANNQTTSFTDPLGNTTTWTYDGSGNLKTMVNALSQTTTYNTYDGNGRLISVTDPLSLTTTFAYDKLGRMTSQKVGGLTTSYTWDSGANKVSKVTYPDNSTLTYTFDDAHRVIQVKDTAGDAIKYTFDDNSNLTAVNVYDPTPTLKFTHSYTYDTANRTLTSVGAAMGETTTFAYDNQSNLLSITDPLGNTTTNSYDALNRLATSLDALGNTTTFGFDVLDRLTTVTDPRGLVTSYGYDGLSNTTTIISPDTGTTVMTYDAAGNLLTSTDARSKVATYSYDALSRTTTISYTGGASIGFTYDSGTNGTGHLTQMVDPAGTTAWTYDQFGNVLTKKQTTGALTLTTTYTYDADERPSTIKYPSTKTLTYAYDSSGRISGITGGVTSITYFPFGPPKQWTQPNASTYVRGFDQDGRITSVTLNSTTTNVQTITYDNASNITGLTETGLSNKAYGYDADNRLTSFFNGTTTTSYTFDANGNRTTTALSGTTTYTYSGSSNQLQSLTGTTTAHFGYDALGNTTSDGTNVWTYDSRGRMSTLLAGTTTASYGINGIGQRISKTGNTVPNGGTNEFVYDDQGHLLGEYGSTGTIIEETAYLSGTPIAVFTGASGGTTSSVTADWIGAPHIVTNSSKTYQWRWDHYDFGNNAPNQNPAGLGIFNYNLRFPGQYYDAESALYYNNNRDYNPTLGRYIQSDPIGLPSGINMYGYADGNPVNNTDRQGLCIDPGGTGIRYCIEEYIPEASAWGFGGDNRGPMSAGGTFRSQQLIWNGPNGQIVSSTTPGTSHFGGQSKPGNQGPHAVSGQCTANSDTINATDYTSNGFFPGGGPFGAPYAWYNLKITETGGNAVVTGTNSRFPNLEVWEYGNGAPTLIYNYQHGSYGPSDISGPPITIQ